MKRITQSVLDFAADESGATAIEYGLLSALIAMVVIGSASMVGHEVDRNFRCLKNGLRGVARFNDGRGPCG